MLLYLSGHTRPDITFAVSQCARYSFCPKKSHEEALKRIGRYLKGTKDKGIFMKPQSSLQIDCYVDADFAGLWNHEDTIDPTSVRSCSGFLLLLAAVLYLGCQSYKMKQLCLPWKLSMWL